MKLMIWTAPPPSSVILRPPSMTVFLFDGTFSVAVTRIVTGSGPQLKVMTPPAVTAVCSALNVQLAAVPVPMTAVGLDVLAACAIAGTPAAHDPFGLPAFQAGAPPLPVVPPEPVVPAVPVVPPRPAAPVVPAVPVVPAAPVVPPRPAEPVVPADPVVPPRPAEPVVPAVPVVPPRPAAPAAPVVPPRPLAPAAPVVPAVPVVPPRPPAPALPVVPPRPPFPVAPLAPPPPTEPATPLEPAAPVVPPRPEPVDPPLPLLPPPAPPFAALDPPRPIGSFSGGLSAQPAPAASSGAITSANGTRRADLGMVVPSGWSGNRYEPRAPRSGSAERVAFRTRRGTMGAGAADGSQALARRRAGDAGPGAEPLPFPLGAVHGRDASRLVVQCLLSRRFIRAGFPTRAFSSFPPMPS
jgi:hypothetical protein